MVAGKSMHGSVTLCPYTRVDRRPGSCLPATRLLSSITPAIPRSPAQTCPATAMATASWRR